MTDTSGVTTDLAGLRDLVGTHVGYTDWQEMTQDVVNRFADVTGDHNYIHVDVERARRSPFGGTIAHGYLTLSLAAPVIMGLLRVSDASTGVNYGLDRVRFPAPLRVGARWRGGIQVAEVSDIQGGAQAKVVTTVEVQGSEKPAMVAEALIRWYR